MHKPTNKPTKEKKRNTERKNNTTSMSVKVSFAQQKKQERQRSAKWKKQMCNKLNPHPDPEGLIDYWRRTKHFCICLARGPEKQPFRWGDYTFKTNKEVLRWLGDHLPKGKGYTWSLCRSNADVVVVPNEVKFIRSILPDCNIRTLLFFHGFLLSYFP
jgi:hypothetical protein